LLVDTTGVNVTGTLDVSGDFTVNTRIMMQTAEAVEDIGDGWLRLNNNTGFTNGVYTPGHLRVDGNISAFGNIVGDGVTTISGIETVTIDSTGDITKSSHGNYLYHASTTYDNDQNGQITFSTSAPSGGTDGDIWFQYT
jgi:hypothetical protein